MLYKFSVNRLEVRCLNLVKTIISDSTDYHIAQFTFSEHWNDFAKTVVFTNSHTKVSVNATLDVNGRCYIPWETLKLDKVDKRVHVNLIVGIYGVNIDNPHMTMWTDMKVPLTIIKSDKCNFVPPKPPTPTIFEQLLSKIGKKADNLDYRDNTLYLKSEDKVLSKIEITASGLGVNYNDLGNKPSINDVELYGNKTNEELGIPTKTSDLYNDKDFISSDEVEAIDIDFSNYFSN